MRALIQRVEYAKVDVEGKTVADISHGLLVFLGVGVRDTVEDVDWMVKKVPNLRIFEDEKGKMNRSLLEVNGEMLVVSQFTLYGDCKRGRRPSFSNAAPAEKAREFYELFCDEVEKMYRLEVKRGIFQAEMKVSLLNDGPVTLLVEGK